MRYVSLIFFDTLYSMYIRTITILRSKLKFNRSFKSATILQNTAEKQQKIAIAYGKTL